MFIKFWKPLNVFPRPVTALISWSRALDHVTIVIWKDKFSFGILNFHRFEPRSLPYTFYQWYCRFVYSFTSYFRLLTLHSGHWPMETARIRKANGSRYLHKLSPCYSPKYESLFCSRYWTENSFRFRRCCVCWMIFSLI